MKLIIALTGTLLVSACIGPQPCQEGVSYCHAVHHRGCTLFGDDCDAVSYIAGDNCEIMATYPWGENQTEKVVAGTSCDVPEAYSEQTCDFIQNQTYAENADGTGVKLVFEKQSETSGFLFLGEAFEGEYGEYTCQSNLVEIVFESINASASLGDTKGELTFNYNGESYLLLRQAEHWSSIHM